MVWRRNVIMSIPTTIIDPVVKEFLRKSQALGSQEAQGIGCTEIVESIPTYESAGCERVFQGKNNTYIVLGRDRPGTEFSGCGGRGDTQCGMIDLVAGRVSSTIMKRLKNTETNSTLMTLGAQSDEGINEMPSGTLDHNTVVDNNFFADAARLYLTQRAINIDEYLGFKNVKGSNPTELSAAVIKSDCTRIVGRESVRIYAGGARGDGFGPFGESRANGTDIENAKIELIVGNQGEDNMQPAVLGENLISYLTAMKSINNKKLKILQSLITQVTQNSAALSVLSFGATSGIMAQQMIQNVENLRNILNELYNEVLNDINHLDIAIVPGSKSILSKNVFIT